MPADFVRSSSPRLFIVRPGLAIRLFGGLCALLLLCLPLTAKAANQLAVLMPAPSGDPLPAALRQRLDKAVVDGLHTMNIQLVGDSERDTILQGEASLQSCETADCLERLGRLLGVTAVIRYKVQTDVNITAARRPYQLQLFLHNVEVGAQGASTTQTCSGCTADDAARLLQDMATQAITADAARPRGTLHVETTPPNAVLFVDSNELGPTPYHAPAFAGSHNLLLRATGFLSMQSKVEVNEGRTARVALTLVPGNDPTAGGETKPLYKKWWFWVAIGGAAAVVTAVTVGVVVGTSGGPSEPPRSPNHIAF